MLVWLFPSVALAGDYEAAVEKMEVLFDAVEAAAPARRAAAVARVDAAPEGAHAGWRRVSGELDVELQEAAALLREVDELARAIEAADPWLVADLPARVGRLRLLASGNLADAVGTTLLVDQAAAARLFYESQLGCSYRLGDLQILVGACEAAPLVHGLGVLRAHAPALSVSAGGPRAVAPVFEADDRVSFVLWRSELTQGCGEACAATAWGARALEAGWRWERTIRDELAEAERAATRAEGPVEALEAWSAYKQVLEELSASERAAEVARVEPAVLASAARSGDGWAGVDASYMLLSRVPGTFEREPWDRAALERRIALESVASWSAFAGVQWAGGASAVAGVAYLRRRWELGAAAEQGLPGRGLVGHAVWGAAAPYDSWSSVGGLNFGLRGGWVGGSAALGAQVGARLGAGHEARLRSHWGLDAFVDARGLAGAPEPAAVLGVRLYGGFNGPIW